MIHGDKLRWFILIKLTTTSFFLNIQSIVKVLFRKRYERRFTYAKYSQSATCVEMKITDLTLKQ